MSNKVKSTETTSMIMKPYNTCMLWIIIQPSVLLLSHLILCLCSFNNVEHCPMQMGEEGGWGGGGGGGGEGGRRVRKWEGMAS